MCAAAKIAPEGMVTIPGGRFRMGADGGFAEEGPVHDAVVSSFAMDSYPVTNGQYRAFCDATGRPCPQNPRWEEMPDYFLSYPDHPVVNVNYADAAAYANWVG